MKENNKRTAIGRDKVIIKTSIIGIVVNVFLVVFKIVIGFLSGSIAIILDAINNLSDALSSIITIVGMKLAMRPANKEHPFGYGRSEYLTAILIAALVLFAGGSSAIESVKKVINPTSSDFNSIMLIIIGVAIIVKILLGNYTKKIGKKVNSDSLIASGTDAKFDAVISLATLVSGIVSLLGGYNLDGILGIIISVFILKAGFEMLHETLKKILGERQDNELTEEVKKLILSNKEVMGVYDLVLHNYGPEYMIGSAHIEVPDNMTAKEINVITRKLRKQAFTELNIALTIGIYAVDIKDGKNKKTELNIRKIVLAEDYILRMHAFYLDEVNSIIYFDVVIDFAAPKTEDVAISVNNKLSKAYPEYKFILSYDSDYSCQ